MTAAEQDTFHQSLDRALSRRGTSNSNARGSAADRRRRRQWLVETYRANADLHVCEWADGRVTTSKAPLGSASPACRCYRCGTLLTVDTVTVDRIVPGCKGGTYRRNNIRPACSTCNSETGAALANGKAHQAAKRAAQKRAR